MMMSQAPLQQVMNLATGYMASAAFYVLVKLKVADKLAEGPRTAESLAKDASVNTDALYRVLRLVSSLGVFEQSGEREFRLNPAAQLLRSDVPGTIYDMLVFLPDPFHFGIYSELLHSVTTGKPAIEKALGQPLFEYLDSDTEYAAVFNDAMTSFSVAAADAVMEAYDFSGFQRVVDVGGGHGEVLLSILERVPDIECVLAEVDHVAEGARNRFRDLGVSNRCASVACDFFESVPTGGDAYVLKHIIHDWDDERARLILKNVHAAMKDETGCVLLIEQVLPEGEEADFGKFLDIEMLVLPGGRERTKSEFRELLASAGFELKRIIPTDSGVSVIEAFREGQKHR